MATTADLEAAFEDAVLKLKNAQLEWITAKSEESTDDEASCSESTEQGDIEDYTQESVDQTVNAGQSSENEHELRPVWFVPNIFQLRPILGYSTNETANAETGYSTCSDHEKADQYHTELEESQGTTTLKPVQIEGQYSPYFNMYYGSDGQVYGCAKKLTVHGESTERTTESVEEFGTESVDVSTENAVEKQPADEYHVEDAAVEELAGDDGHGYTEEEGEDQYYVYEDVEGHDGHEKAETINDIEDLAEYDEDEGEVEVEGEYYSNEECAAEYGEDVGYSEELEEDGVYAQYDEVAEVIVEDDYECEGENEELEGVDTEAYAEYEGEVEEEGQEELEAFDVEKDQDYDEACAEDEYQDGYDEEEYSTEAVAEQVDYVDEVPKQVFYEKKPKDHVYDNYLPSKPTALGDIPVGNKAAVVENSGASEQAKAYSFYKNDEEDEAQEDPCTGYVDAYGNPCTYNPLYVPVNGYY